MKNTTGRANLPFANSSPLQRLVFRPLYIRLSETLRAARLRHRMLKEYRELDQAGDHILRDIGITRDDLGAAKHALSRGELPSHLLCHPTFERFHRR